jgi:hypothetical protein
LGGRFTEFGALSATLGRWLAIVPRETEHYEEARGNEVLCKSYKPF